MYIVPSNFSDTEIDGIVGNVTALLEKNGAKVEKTDILGKLKLAYPIKKVRHGTYVLSYVSFEGAEVFQKLDTELKHTDEVLRHMFVKREEGISPRPVRLTSYVAPLTPEGKRTAVKDAPVVKKQVAPTEKLSTEELDKKLDEILETEEIKENV